MLSIVSNIIGGFGPYCSVSQFVSNHEDHENHDGHEKHEKEHVLNAKTAEHAVELFAVELLLDGGQ